MDYTAELVAAIERFMTREGGTVADIQSSFRDVQGWTPDREKVLTGLARLAKRGDIRRDGDRYFHKDTDDNPLDLRYPANRPGFLGEHQPWPCGRCGVEVDNSERHDCKPPATPVVMPDAARPNHVPGAKAV